MYEYKLVEELNEGLKKQVFEILCELNHHFVPALSDRHELNTRKDFPYSPHLPHGYLHSIENNKFICVFDNNQLIAFLSFREADIELQLQLNSPALYINTTCVRKDYHNQGIAKKLYSYVEHQLPESYQFPMIVRKTWSTNTTQIHLYEKTGFHLLKVVENDRGIGIHSLYYGKAIFNGERKSFIAS